MQWKQELIKRLQLTEQADPVLDKALEVASVLIPVGWNRDTQRDEIWMTKRTMTVDSHKGQIGFPGGYREETDLDLKSTALREVHEEIGVSADSFEVLGRLQPVTTHRSDVVVFPWIGMTKFPLSLTLNRAEVDRMVIIPLIELVEKGLSSMSVPVGSFSVKTIGIWIGEDLIWGASARMLEQLVEHLRACDYPNIY